MYYVLQALGFCGPDMEDCVQSQTVRDKSCLASCTGLYADISDDFFSKNLQQTLIKGNV